jgi:hypothetical protein
VIEPEYSDTGRLSGEAPQMAEDGRKPGGHGAKSEAVRQRAILALLSEPTIGKAAERCGVGERTLRRWLTDDALFQRQLAETRRAMFETAMNRLQPLAAQAVDTLAALMGESAPPSVRLGAARTVAELGIHRDDAETILRKLGEIEALQRRTDAEER